MRIHALPPIPFETRRAAWALFGGSNFYLTVGDRADYLFDGLWLDEAARRTGEPVWAIAIAYLITIFQFLETLPDHLAANALRERIDWKYALHLPLNHPGVEDAKLCRFRKFLLTNHDCLAILQTLQLRLCQISGADSNESLTLDASRVVDDVCRISRLAGIWDAINQALGALAMKYPDWLLSVSRPHWYERYGSYHKNIDLKTARNENCDLAQAIGTDGHHLLQAIAAAGDPALAGLDEIIALRQMWREQFDVIDRGVIWRSKACTGCSSSDKMSAASIRFPT